MNINTLFEPARIGSLEVANRIVMAPMTRSMSPGNIAHEKVARYYRQRAAGGTGLIITEGTCVDHPAANGYPDVPYFYGEKALAGWKKVVEAVHAEGGKIAPQLWHVGGVRRPGTEPDPTVPGYGPSGLSRPGKQTGHEMTTSDIDDVVSAFAVAARHAQDIGFDAIEIHGAHGYLIDQFFWPGTNLRSDAYGIDKSKFAIEIVRAIRGEVSADLPVILRWSQWKMQDYTAKLAETPKQLEEFLAPLVDAGVDVFHCSQRRFWEAEFEESDLNLAGWVKKLTGRPTITVGSIGLDDDFINEKARGFSDAKTAGLDALHKRMDAGEFDLAAVGRAMISNPDWANRMRENNPESLKPFDKKDLASLD